METVVKYYYDNKTLECVQTRFFIDGEELSFEDYMYIIGGLKEESSKKDDLVEDDCDCMCDGDCDDCCDERFAECVNEDEECEVEECQCKNELSEEQIEEIKLIASYVEDVLEVGCCPNCIFNVLTDLFFVGKEIGWDNHRDYIRECNED